MSNVERAITTYVNQYEPRAGWTRTVFAVVVLAILLTIIGIPLLVYVWGSFWTDLPLFGGGQFTLEGYQKLFTPRVLPTVKNTLMYAVLGTTIAMSIAIMMLILTIKMNIRGRLIITMALLTAYLLPGYVWALAWDVYAAPNGFLNQVLIAALPFISEPVLNVRSIWGMSIAAGTNYAGLVYLLTAGAIRYGTRQLEEAAIISGATKVTIMRKIILRLAVPALAISLVLVFSRLLQDFTIALVLGLPARIFVVSTFMFVAVRSFPTDFTFISALGMTILSVSLLGLYVQRTITGAREQYETIGEEGQESLRYDIGGYIVPLQAALWAFLVMAYIMPLVILMAASFQSGYTIDVLDPNLTLDNYRDLVSGNLSDQFFTSLRNTLLVCGGGAFVGMSLSTFASYIIVKSDSKLSVYVDYLTLTPAAIPGIIVAVVFLWFIIRTRLIGNVNSLIFVVVAFTSSFVVYGTRAMNSAYRSIGGELEEAAMISNAGFLTILRRVYFPLIVPGFVSGYALLFIGYIKILTIPLLLTTNEGELLLQVLLWNRIAFGDIGVSAALSMVIMAIVTLMYIAVQTFTDYEVTSI